MRRLVSLPIAVLLSLLMAGTALASFCGNDSKPGGAGQKAVLWVNIAAETVTVVEGANRGGRLTGGFVDVYLDFDGNGSAECFIDDTYLLSEHELGHIAAGQLLDGLAVNPAIHRGNNPGGSHGMGFAAIADLGGCPFA